MNYLEAFKFIVRFLPCIVRLFNELSEAKKDDGKVDAEEVIKMAENFITCITSKLTVPVK